MRVAITRPVAVAARRRWRRRSSRSAGYGAGSPADCSTEGGTMTAADRTPDRSPCPGAEQAAADRALARIIRVRAGGQRQYQPGGNDAWSDQSHHFISSQKGLPRHPPICRRRGMSIMPISNTAIIRKVSIGRPHGGAWSASNRRTGSKRGSIWENSRSRWAGSRNWCTVSSATTVPATAQGPIRQPPEGTGSRDSSRTHYLSNGRAEAGSTRERLPLPASKNRRAHLRPETTPLIKFPP